MQETVAISNNNRDLVKKYLPSETTIESMCAFFSIFSDVTRVRILTAISICEMCVSDLAILLELNQTTVSHQLKLLKDSGIVRSRRSGKIIFYAAANEHINDIMMTGTEYLGF